MTRRTSPRAAERARYTFLHELPCAVTGRDGIEVAHIRGADALFGKPLTGMGIKPHWVWTLPLSPDAHATQHREGELIWWRMHGYPWRDLTRGPMAAALILEGFRSMNDVDGARAWLRARVGAR